LRLCELRSIALMRLSGIPAEAVGAGALEPDQPSECVPSQRVRVGARVMRRELTDRIIGIGDGRTQRRSKVTGGGYLAQLGEGSISGSN
jgi:hypothetical protein